MARDDGECITPGCIFQHPVHELHGRGSRPRKKDGEERKRERENSVSVSSAARGLVYSCASDDNVHEALNLPLLPLHPRAGSRRGSFFGSFCRCIISYSIPSAVRSPSCVALRFVLSSSPALFSSSSSSALPSSTFLLLLFFLLLLYLLFLRSVSAFWPFFSTICSCFMHAGVPSRRGESTRIIRDASSHEDTSENEENECLYTDN